MSAQRTIQTRNTPIIRVEWKIMEERGRTSEEVCQQLEALLANDSTFNSGRIIGSMCTLPHELGRKVYTRYLEKNLGDPGLFPATARLEREAIEMMGTLLSNPKAVGNIVTGGTEANVIALDALRNRESVVAKSAIRREIIAPASVHCSFDKAARLLGLRLTKVPLTETFQVDVEATEHAINAETLALVGIAGTTSLGVVDPIDTLSQLAMENDLRVHVDAAFGGFVLPFLRDLGHKPPEFDFKVPGVSTITIDPHKMGLAPIPAGGILFRDSHLQRPIEHRIPYLAGGETHQSTLVGTRSGSSVLAVWALLRHLGKEGYRNIVRRCMTLTHKLADQIRQVEGVDLMVQPVTNVLGIKSDVIQVRRIAQKLREKGWAVSLFPRHIRIVVMPHISAEHIESFLHDLEAVVKELGQ
jgi:tyrosine decarboxylase/aspartate 1-decarboxylase